LARISEINAAFKHAGLTTRCQTLLQKYFHVVKVTQYVLYEEDRTPT